MTIRFTACRVIQNTTARRLTLDESKQLEAFRLEHGKRWKSKLRQLWSDGSVELRSIRNKLGPSALDRIRFVELTEKDFN